MLTSRLRRVFLQIPSPYAAAQHPQQQQQQQQQQGMPGPCQQYPFPLFVPMLLSYGMLPPAEGMPPGPFQMHMGWDAAWTLLAPTDSTRSTLSTAPADLLLPTSNNRCQHGTANATGYYGCNSATGYY